MKKRLPVIILRGGGDLASGVAIRLRRAGLNVVITELSQPLVVRRLVAFASAVYENSIDVEGVTAKLVSNAENALRVLQADGIPVLVDPDCEVRFAEELNVCAIVDARMTKRPPYLGTDAADMMIGLGPGFVAGENCHAVIETMRGHYLGRVIWDGAPQPNTGAPGSVAGHKSERVLRAPIDGILRIAKKIGNHVLSQEKIAEVDGQPILAPFDGVLRGLLHDGLTVKEGMKVGDVDARGDPQYARLVSEKSLAIAGGVLEALLTRPEIRNSLWS
ncbi:MAG: EF2563 family selenium-dependent molybdenum hydroxylase system protein [Anaerolineales bacterium]|nr:EF2563 family selenium-dependent molybdenum hydroxylase system protein [Anaerolineales bacterium]